MAIPFDEIVYNITAPIDKMTVRHTVVDKDMAEVVTDIKILKKRKEIQL